MKKLWIIPLLLWNLEAETFDVFLQKALQNSPYLKANSLHLSRIEQESALMQRYKNPTLALEASRFSPDAKKSQEGYRTALTQPLRLWGVADKRALLAKALTEQNGDAVSMQRARFIQKISLLYVAYMQAAALEQLSRKELQIAQTIEAISLERYKAGTIAKVKYLLAKLDTKRAKNICAQRGVQKTAAYYALLALSGLEDEPDLESSYHFELMKKEKQRGSIELAYIKSSEQKALAEAKLNEHSIEWLNLTMEYEKEPEQSIARVGLEIPLALFNTKKEERQIAKIEAKQKSLLIQNQTRAVDFTLRRIQKELQGLVQLQKRTDELYKAQQEMLTMYEDGYKIANIKLIELQTLKSQMIETQQKAIALQRQIDTNIINYNYNAGAYNEQ
jgi:cobalt-zinc-cadmium efflux system outer membrane protein